MAEATKTAAPATEQPKSFVHPSLRPRKRAKSTSNKQRRTSVRVVKLIAEGLHRVDGQNDIGATLVQMPIEPTFNNGGSRDLNAPLRFALDKKGYVWPHEYDPEQYPGIYCAVLNCWDWATVTHQPDNGTERCVEHEAAWRAGLLRYQDPASGQGNKSLEDYIAEIDAWVIN